MNRIQKMAWWLVIWFSAAVILAAIAITILHFVNGMPWSIARAGLKFLGIAGFGGLGLLIFKKDPDKATCDERERSIYIKATLTGLVAASLITGLACMLPFFIMGPDAMISVGWLPDIFLAVTFTFFFIQSAAILIQYGWKQKGEQL
jgi:hypothetical protein